MSNIQTRAERMPHKLSHLGFLAGQIGRLITISTTPVIAGDSFEMDAVGALRLSPLRRGLSIDSTVDIFTFYVPHRHVYGEQWIKCMKDGVNATPRPTVNTTGYIDHAAFLFSSRRRHTRCSRDWSSDVCSSDLEPAEAPVTLRFRWFSCLATCAAVKTNTDDRPIRGPLPVSALRSALGHLENPRTDNGSRRDRKSVV